MKIKLIKFENLKSKIKKNLENKIKRKHKGEKDETSIWCQMDTRRR